MEEKKFLDEVLGHIPRLTARERQSLRRELSDHVADHVEMLERRGLDEETAREQAVNAMGDPEEVGRELAKAYSPFWYWVLQAANLLLTAAIVFALIWGITGPLLRARTNLELRNDPEKAGRIFSKPEIGYAAVDIHIPMVTDEMRIYGVELDRKNAVAYVLVCTYDKNPFGYASRLQYGAVTVTNQAGQAREGEAMSWTEPWEWEPGRIYYNIPVSPGDTCVYFTYDRFGTHVEHTLPLPEWEGEE